MAVPPLPQGDEAPELLPDGGRRAVEYCSERGNAPDELPAARLIAESCPEIVVCSEIERCPDTRGDAPEIDRFECSP